MAIISYSGNDIDISTNTFRDLVTRTNEISNDLAINVFSVGNNNIGDFELTGDFGSSGNVAVAGELFGGTIGAKAALAITSNTSVTATTFTVNANTTVGGTNATINANTTFNGRSTFSANTTVNGTTLTVNANTVFGNTGAIRLPNGTTAQRPSGASGEFRFNTSTNEFEGHDGTEWGSIGGGLSVSDDTTTNSTFYLPFTSQTSSAELAALTVSSTKLTFNPSTGTLGATDYNSLSDITYKKDLQTISESESIINNIDTYSFRWKETGKKSYGVVAQELEKILPELINETNGSKYVNYLPLIAILLDGYKKLNRRVQQLEK